MSEIETLRERLAELERERDALAAERDVFAQQYAELLILQQVFTAMNSTMELDDILAMVLRGIREALGFARVVLFSVEGGLPRRHLQTSDDQGIVSLADDRTTFAMTVTMQAIASGESQFAMGQAGDDESPLSDAAGPYCLLPLVSRGTVRGILYADRPANETIAETQLQALFDFGAQAAMVIENARLFHETQALASTDALTGLLNRRALLEQLEREIFNAERYVTGLALMLIDLDDLKKINDTAGHAAGDDALRRVGSALKSGARKGDIVARYAGDEFVIVIMQADHRAAETAAERVLRAVHGHDLRCSAGVAVFPIDGVSVDTLIEAADRALYKAKQNGKDRVEFSSIIVR
jgi:diguanylate cyclase (GGDEF)-like protein